MLGGRVPYIVAKGWSYNTGIEYIFYIIYNKTL